MKEVERGQHGKLVDKYILGIRKIVEDLFQQSHNLYDFELIFWYLGVKVTITVLGMAQMIMWDVPRE